MAIPCSRDGRTPTYGLVIEDDAGGIRRMVFAGLTGEFTETEDAETFGAILAAAGPRRDAR